MAVVIITPAVAHSTTSSPSIPSPAPNAYSATEPATLSHEPSRENGTKEIHSRDQAARQKRDQAVEDGAGVDVSAHAAPLDLALDARQGRRREPADAQLEGQRVVNDQPRAAAPAQRSLAAPVFAGRRAVDEVERARAVGGGAVDDAAVLLVDVVLGHAVQQHVEPGAHVHVAQLEGAGQREHERDVLLLPPLVPLGRVRERPGGDPAGERRVGVQVELEQVVQGVVDGRDGAFNLALDAVAELERAARLVARREGNPLELVCGLVQFNVLACFSVVSFGAGRLDVSSLFSSLIF